VRKKNTVAKIGKSVVTFTGEGSSVPALLTTAEVAAVLNVSKSSLNKWRGTGQGPQYVEVEGAIRYTPQAVADYIAANTRTSTSETAAA
jgi:hypothetical protein